MVYDPDGPYGWKAQEAELKKRIDKQNADARARLLQEQAKARDESLKKSMIAMSAMSGNVSHHTGAIGSLHLSHRSASHMVGRDPDTGKSLHTYVPNIEKSNNDCIPVKINHMPSTSNHNYQNRPYVKPTYNFNTRDKWAVATGLLAAVGTVFATENLITAGAGYFAGYFGMYGMGVAYDVSKQAFNEVIEKPKKSRFTSAAAFSAVATLKLGAIAAVITIGGKMALDANGGSLISKTQCVTSDIGVNIRTEPTSWQSEQTVITRLPFESTVQTRGAKINDDWYRATTNYRGQTITGYVHSAYLGPCPQ